MFDVNVLGVLYADPRRRTPHAHPRLGDVVFVSSLAGRRVPAPDGTVYAAKARRNRPSRRSAPERVPGGVRVINVEPGLVRTEFPENLPKRTRVLRRHRLRPAGGRGRSSGHPLRRQPARTSQRQRGGGPPHRATEMRS